MSDTEKKATQIVPAKTAGDNRKRNEFIRLVEANIKAAGEAFRHIGNLADPTRFPYTESDVKRILWTLYQEFRILEERFLSEEPNNFRLPRK